MTLALRRTLLVLTVLALYAGAAVCLFVILNWGFNS